MRLWIMKRWDNVSSSLWFLPSILVCIAFALAIGLIEVDVYLAAQNHTVIPYLFSGSADAARNVLSSIAGSLLTVLSIAFSLTMIALQQASQQFSPRVLRSITSSRVNQFVVGTYAGTFIYALLVLRTVRGADSVATFVPALSVTISVVLALVCIGWSTYVHGAFAQIRRTARADLSVTLCLLRVLRMLGEHITLEERAMPLRAEILEVKLAIDAQDFSEADVRALREAVARAEAALSFAALAVRSVQQPLGDERGAATS